MEDFLCF